MQYILPDLPPVICLCPDFLDLVNSLISTCLYYALPQQKSICPFNSTHARFPDQLNFSTSFSYFLLQYSVHLIFILQNNILFHCLVGKKDGFIKRYPKQRLVFVYQLVSSNLPSLFYDLRKHIN